MVEYRTILVALDGSENSERAFDTAVTLAKKFGSKLVLAHVMDMQYFMMARFEPAYDVRQTEDGKSEVVPQRPEYHREYGRRVLALAKDRVPADMETEVAYVVGSPRSDLLTMIEERHADLVVMGTRGHSGLMRMLMGSVSEYIVQHSPVPVVVVK